MSIDSRTQVFDASGQLRLANGNFIFIISASALVTIVLNKLGSSETFAANAAGLLIARVKNWDFAFLQAAPGTTVSFFYGIGAFREDNTDFRQALATISGSVNVQTIPSATYVDTPDVAQAITSETAIAANLLRRRITIGVLSTSLAGVRVSFTGGGNTRGIEIQPGTFVEFDTTAALKVRNIDAVNVATWYAEEES